MAFLSFLTAVSLSLSTAYAAIGPVTDLRITNKNVSPDGVSRPAVLAGGTLPGPTIKGNKGDHFKINVIDELTNPDMFKSTSIHWHGLFQKGTNWADGPAFVTQCPITTGNSFLYDFRVPDQAGTFWYHSHLSVQYCDGLRGPMVIYDPHDPHKDLYDVDDDSTIITLADWYHTLARQITGPARSDATLINGLGRSPTGPPDAELAVITVQRNKRYRFRLVSLSCDPNFIFSIDNHTMTVIEVDGENTQSLTVDSIQIFAGQRYSFVLHANQPENNYWIRAQPNTGNTTFIGGLNSAILRYVGAPKKEPVTVQQPSKTPLKEIDLRPLKYTPVPGKPYPGGADIVKNLALSFNGGKFFINNQSFVPPTVPVLLQILSGHHDASELLPPGGVIGLERNKVVEITLPGGVIGSPHPFHLHGHSFWVVRSAGSDKYNFNDPVIRDVVNIGGNSDDLVTIRFVTDNPGPWFLHCHIDFHLEAGFAIVFAEGINETAAANPVPHAWYDLCPKYDALAPGDQ
ncbi:laccase 5 [Panus rudis PR-1116 ss-1]|nr:laccase 5 [Panus rudis PR-1116 ss-1]